LLYCYLVLRKQKNSETQSDYRLIFSSFMPTSEIKIDGEKAYLMMEQLIILWW